MGTAINVHPVAECEHRRLSNLYPGGLTECAFCGEPLGVLHQERGPSPDLVIYDEAQDLFDDRGRSE